MKRSYWQKKYSKASFFKEVSLSFIEAPEVHQRSYYWLLELDALHFFNSFRDLLTIIPYLFLHYLFKFPAFFLLFFILCQVLDRNLVLRLWLLISLWAENFKLSSQELDQFFNSLALLNHLLVMASTLELVFWLNAFGHEHMRL